MKSRALLILLSLALSSCGFSIVSSSTSPSSEPVSETSEVSSEAPSSVEETSEATSSEETTSEDISSEEEPSTPSTSEEESAEESSVEEESSLEESSEAPSEEPIESSQESEESEEPSSEDPSIESSEDETSEPDESSAEISESEEPSSESEEPSSEPSSESEEPSIESSEYSVPEGPFDTWTLVTSISDLHQGDTVIMANSERGKIAGSYATSSSSFLASDAEFSADSSSIVSFPAETTLFTVGQSGSYWTFRSEDGLIYGNADSKNKPFLSLTEGDERWSITIEDGDATITNATSTYGLLEYNPSSPRFKSYKSTTSGMKPVNLYKGSVSTPIWPTSIALSGKDEVAVNKTITLDVSFEPADTNRKSVTWSSENTDIATVEDGVVRGVSVGQTRIWANAEMENGELTSAYFDITVSEAVLDAYTIMIYMCGSNLESYDSDYRQYGSQASDNLAEIMKVDLPDNVNIIVETGGAKNWDPSYASRLGASIPAELTRWTVEDNHLAKEETSLQPSDGSMGLASTFQDFMEWGIENYPATKTGVIMWNHGGAMDGCCADERYSDDMLTPAEMNEALQASFASTSTEKLEWIGYDCCLMSVQDIADLNSDYFNYMVSSQETEPGGGWDYDAWVADLAANPDIDTVSLGKSICDSYYTKCGDTYYSYYEYNHTQYAEYKDFNDATLALLDLTKMATYREAFESMANGLASIITSKTKWNTFTNLVNQAEKYGLYPDDWAQSYNDGYVYDVFNLSTFLTKLKANSTYSSVDVDSVIEALDELISYNKNGKDSPNACGLSFFCAISGANYKSTYSSTQTRFSSWRSLNIQYGKFYS